MCVRVCVCVCVCVHARTCVSACIYKHTFHVHIICAAAHIERPHGSCMQQGLQRMNSCACTWFFSDGHRVFRGYSGKCRGPSSFSWFSMCLIAYYITYNLACMAIVWLLGTSHVLCLRLTKKLCVMTVGK